MLLRVFDQYGWGINGVFYGMVGFLQRNQAEIQAVGMMLHTDRMNVVDYTDGTFVFQYVPNFPYTHVLRIN